jgi:molybdopterin-guanine dinucleotide biosynthesis protein MobB
VRYTGRRCGGTGPIGEVDEADGKGVKRDQKTPAGPVTIGVVLAGGEARRMGRDKRTLRLAGASLLERNVELLRSIFPTVVVSVREDRPLPLALPAGVEVLFDQVTGCPLGGIATALAHFGAPVFVLAADTAFAERAAVQRVLEAFDGVDMVVPIVDGHLEPLHAVYGPGCLQPAQALLESGRNSILELLPRVRVATIGFDSIDPFFNVNTPEDLEEARRRADEARPRPARSAGGGPAGGQPVVVGVIGKSGSGKTTLIEQLIPQLRQLGLRVGTVKSVAGFQIDSPGKDSWRHHEAGAEAYVVVSPTRLAYVADLREEVDLAHIVARFFAGFDVVLCEGFRAEAPTVIEVFRRDAGHLVPLCGPADSLALVTDADIEHEHRFALGDAGPLARFIAERLGLPVRSA